MNSIIPYRHTAYRTRRKDGTGYTVTATATGYTMDGTAFATLAAALTAALTAHEQAQEAIARKAAQHDLQI